MSTEQATTVQEGEYTITEVSTTTLATVVGAEIDTQIATAKQFPRSLTVFKQRALGLATISQEVAESCEYGLPRGNSIIKGPSVRLAEIVAASYGNMRIGARVVSNNGRTITAQGICHDLETNVCITIEVSRSVLQHEKKNGVKTGRMIPMNEDMQTLAGNAASSIALRNAIFRVVPKAAWNEIFEESKKIALGSVATLPERRSKAIDFFKSKGVTEEQILKQLDVPGIEDIDLEKLSTLSAMKAALKNNEANLQNLFPTREADDKAKKATDAAEAAIKKNADKKSSRRSANAAADTAQQMTDDLANKQEEQ